MKQKIVIKVMPCDKCRTKALQIAAGAHGVNSVALEGNDKDKVVVIGEGVDAASLTSCLQKKVTYACLESVEEVKPPKVEVKPPKEEVKPPKEEKKEKPCSPCCKPCPPRCELYQVVYEPDPPYTCSIM